jgi:hypothetical protein
VLWIFVTLKNPSLSTGFEPTNLASNVTHVSDMLAASIFRAILMKVAVRISEMSLSFFETTWCNIPGDCHLLVIF